MRNTLTLAAILLLSSRARAQTNWGLDPSFGVNGKVHMNMPPAPQKSGAEISILQPDGKIIAGGNTYDDRHIVLMRFHPDGSLDSSFGTAGVVESAAGSVQTLTGVRGIDPPPRG